jgi:hypothetical protein
VEKFNNKANDVLLSFQVIIKYLSKLFFKNSFTTNNCYLLVLCLPQVSVARLAAHVEGAEEHAGRCEPLK